MRMEKTTEVALTADRKYYAEVFNQFGRPLGSGFGNTQEEAIAAAKSRADREIASGNPNWKWRKAKTRVRPNPFEG
jgi:hypothetical protein